MKIEIIEITNEVESISSSLLNERTYKNWRASTKKSAKTNKGNVNYKTIDRANELVAWKWGNQGNEIEPVAQEEVLQLYISVLQEFFNCIAEKVMKNTGWTYRKWQWLYKTLLHESC